MFPGSHFKLPLIRLAVSAGVVGTVALLAAAPLIAQSSASPPRRPGAAPMIYSLQGDVTNPLGQGTTTFQTTGVNSVGSDGWVFTDSQMNSTTIHAHCLSGPGCSGIFSESTGTGVYGLSSGSYTAGVFGEGNTMGVYGTTDTSGYGVYGDSGGSTGVASAGVGGYCHACDGVYGHSVTYNGIEGSSESGYGAYITTKTGRYALYAANNTKTAGYYAILATGNVWINGTLHASGGVVAPVATSAGPRLAYGENATQNIFSDRGTGTLKGGRAVIAIDPLYAQTVNLGAGYQVFVTPWSADTAGLAVINRTATSFEVREPHGGKGSYQFDWRIEAVRQGYEQARLAPAPTEPAAPAPASPALPAPPLARPAPSK